MCLVVVDTETFQLIIGCYRRIGLFTKSESLSGEDGSE